MHGKWDDEVWQAAPPSLSSAPPLWKGVKKCVCVPWFVNSAPSSVPPTVVSVHDVFGMY